MRYGQALGALSGLIHGDSWTNILTGLGTARDKTMAGVFSTSFRLNDVELSAMYSGDGIAAKIVDIFPNETFRRGVLIKSPDTATSTQVAAAFKALKAHHRCHQAMTWGRLYGGSVIWVGADDGQDPKMPLNEAGITGIHFLDVFDRRNVNPSETNQDPTSYDYGRASVYQINNPETGRLSYVHASRLVIWRGAPTEAQARKLFNGWDYSVLQRPYDDLRSFRSTHKGAEFLMSEAVQSVFKIRGFLSMIGGGKIKDLQTRALVMEMTRGLARTVFLDEGEEYKKEQTTFSGVKDMLDGSANLLAASTDIPVMVLMGISPAGFNATGNNELRSFYDRIEGGQENDVKPRVDRIIHLIACALRVTQPVECGFASLWQETKKEKADRELVEAQTDALLVTNEIGSPEDVAIAGYGGPERQRLRIDPVERRAHPLAPPATPGVALGTPKPNPMPSPKPPGGV